MRALRVSAGKVVEVVDVPRPPAPAGGEVRIRVEAAGICGTDVEIAEGCMAYFTSGRAAYPIVLGHEWTGVVESIGAGVGSLNIGDRVVGECSIGCQRCADCSGGAYHRCAARTETGIMNRQGGCAELISLPAFAVHRVSPAVSLRAAALVEPTAVALNGVRLGGVRAGAHVAVIGDGPIGLLLLLVARAAGAERVVVVGADTRRLELAARLGAAATLDARSEADLPSAIARALGGRAPAIVLEASGAPAGIDAAIAAAAPGATIVLQGLCGGVPARGFDVDRVVVNDLTLRGAVGSPGLRPDAIALIESGAVDPSAIVTDELPLERFAEAFALVRSRAAVKVLLKL